MNFLSKIFTPKSDKTIETCISIYQKAKKKRPNKSERDCLKIVLLTKPPFDYQHNKVIDFILDEQAKNIKELASFIVEYGKDKGMWQNRERNLKFLDDIRNRNADFFREFWGK
ncbi:hypothetical protein KKF38_04910 [Patescibacteria group bacterium]|nr:hypothetical protein [Patescibacteria group bacterium]